jgi:hypothetical protein
VDVEFLLPKKDYKASFDLKWDSRLYPPSKFGDVLDITKSDSQVDETYAIARVASADRAQWRAWRKHVGKLEMPGGDSGSVDGSGWRAVSASVHKAACKAASNDAFRRRGFLQACLGERLTPAARSQREAPQDGPPSRR